MDRQKKASSPTFTVVMIIVSVAVVISIMFLFFMSLRNLTYRQAETNAGERALHLRDNITNILKQYTDVINKTSLGISFALGLGPVSQQNMGSYFNGIIAQIPEIQMLYFTNNNVWNRSGGYAAFSDPNFTPAETWDNTRRPWYIDAKAAGGGAVAYSEPYLDAFFGGIVISASAVVFDQRNTDIGVVAIDILATELENMLNANKKFPQQQIYLVNKDGLFINHSDIDAVMNRDFFSEFGIENHKADFLYSDEYSLLTKGSLYNSARIPIINWMLVIVTPESILNAEVNSLLMYMVLISIINLVAAIYIAILIVNRMTRKTAYEAGLI